MTKRLEQAVRWTAILCLLAASALTAGCRAPTPIYSDVVPVATIEETGPTAEARVLKVGDLLIFPLPDSAQPVEERIREDGTITLPFIGEITAAGKTARELPDELAKKDWRYRPLVPRRDYFHYSVLGEVRSPGPKPYSGKTTVSKAIGAAAGFTEFANKKKVKLIRADGRNETVNVVKTTRDPSHDPLVHPGDRIEVPRKWRFGY